MKIAMPYENGKIFQHYGKSKQVIVYDIECNEVKDSKIYDLHLEGDQSIAEFVKNLGVETLIVGNLGQGAMDSIVAQGITLVRGIDMNIDDVVAMYVKGTLVSNEKEMCNHDHDHDHGHHHH